MEGQASEEVQEGTVVTAGTPIFGYAVAGGRDAVVDVSEARVGYLRVGQSAQLRLPAQPQASLIARIREIARAADSRSRAFRVKLTIEQPDAVKPGMTVLVSLQSRSDVAAVRVPARALFHSGQDPAVWVVSQPQQVLQLRKVAVSRYSAEQVEIRSGLTAGEEVVSRGVHSVSAGEKVRTAPDSTPG